MTEVLKAVILAGGEGTRLRPITLSRPKPMAPIGNRPFLEHMLAHLRRHGVTDVILAMGYLPGPIQDYFGDGERLGLRLSYVVEDHPLGTAGAARNALGHLDGTCFVFNGDVFTTIDLGAVLAHHRNRGAGMTLTLTPVEDPSRFGVVVRDPDTRIRQFIEKPRREEAPTNLINAGIYVLEPSILGQVPPDQFVMFETDVFPRLLQDGTVFLGVEAGGYWVDIGTPAKYLEVNRDYAAGRIDSGVVRHSAWSADEACVGDECVLGPGTLVSRDSTIGDGSVLGAGVTLEGAVVLNAAELGDGVTVAGSVIGQGARVGPGATIAAESVIGDGCSVGAGARLVATRVWKDLSIPPGTRLEGATITSQEELG